MSVRYRRSVFTIGGDSLGALKVYVLHRDNTALRYGWPTFTFLLFSIFLVYRSYRGAVGGDASTKVFIASAPYATYVCKTVVAQNILAPGCSSAAAYVCDRLTVTFILGLLLQTHRSFFVLHNLFRYVQIKRRKFESEGRWQGIPNMLRLL